MERFGTHAKIVIAISLVVIATVCVIFYTKSEKVVTHISGEKKQSVVAPAPASAQLPADTAALSAADKLAYNELLSWVDVPITNQPTISKRPQAVRLPLGWTAREDYLTSVVPDTLPETVKNYRGVIMRPPKAQSLSREDAIFTVPAESAQYFKDACHISAERTVCFGGKSKTTKHVFDLMFYFNK